VSSLHQIDAKASATAAHLYRPRDGYRTQVASLGPMIEYYLPSAPAGPVTIEIVDSAGAVVNSYNSDAPAGGGRGGRGGRGGGGGDPEDPDAAGGGGFGRGRGLAPARVTKDVGVNRFVWDVRHSSGLAVPPGAYQARLKVGATSETQAFTVLIDPNIAAEGTTVADLKEQYEHNVRTRDLTTAVTQLVARVRDAQTKLKGATGADADKAKQIEAIAAKLLAEPVRYGKPGLQDHIRYLAGMTTRADQKVGRDALDRYQVLKKEFDAVKAEVDKLLGVS